MMKKRQLPWIVLFLAPAVFLFALIYVVPLVTVTVTSFFDYRAFPQRFEFSGTANYQQLFADKNFHQAISNTIIWILLHCTLHISFGLAVALVLYRKPFGWKGVRVSYMIPNIISNAAMATIFLNIYNPSYGVLNSVLRWVGLEELQHNWLFNSSTAFPSVTAIWTIFAGYTTTLVLGEILSLDPEVIEAARVDGASGLKLDFFVVLPLVRKMIGTTVIMAATYMLQLFDIIFITTLGGPGRRTTNLALLLYQTMIRENNYGYANSIGVLIIGLGIICMVLIQRVFRMNEDDF